MKRREFPPSPAISHASYVNPEVTHGLPTVLVVVTFFAGVQLVILGTIGEYLGRLFLDHSKSPQFVVRYVRRGSETGD